MLKHVEINDAALYAGIKNQKICFGGNKKLKIYGTLQCKSGKRMKKQNRFFFVSQNEAIKHGYHPCGNCMIERYKTWNENGSV